MPLGIPLPLPVPVRVLPSIRNSAAVVTSSVDADNAVISSAISAHVDSIVNDARRNVGNTARPGKTHGNEPLLSMRGPM